MPARRPKLLIVARHPSAGAGAAALVAAARRLGVLSECFASGPALAGLKERRVSRVVSFDSARHRYPGLPAYPGVERIEHETLRCPQEAVRQLEIMADWLTMFLVASRPTAIVLTDATEQVGVDQVMAIAATRAGIPAVRVRDSWGTAVGIETRAARRWVPTQLRREGLAARYLEIDALGVQLSAKRLGLPADRLSAVGGLFTLDRVIGMATRARRGRVRRQLGLAHNTPLVAYLAQPTRRESSEEAAFDTFLRAVTSSDFAAQGMVLATQEHPREADPADGRLGLHWTAMRAARVYGGRVIDLTSEVLERRRLAFDDVIASSDVFVSSYSNASVEATAMGATAGDSVPVDCRPIGMHLACPAHVRRTMAATRAGQRLHPFGASGAVPTAMRGEDIAPMLADLLRRPATRLRYFSRMRRIGRPGRCAERIVRTAISMGRVGR